MLVYTQLVLHAKYAIWDHLHLDFVGFAFLLRFFSLFTTSLGILIPTEQRVQYTLSWNIFWSNSFGFQVGCTQLLDSHSATTCCTSLTTSGHGSAFCAFCCLSFLLEAVFADGFVFPFAVLCLVFALVSEPALTCWQHAAVWSPWSDLWDLFARCCCRMISFTLLHSSACFSSGSLCLGPQVFIRENSLLGITTGSSGQASSAPEIATSWFAPLLDNSLPCESFSSSGASAVFCFLFALSAFFVSLILFLSAACCAFNSAFSFFLRAFSTLLASFWAWFAAFLSCLFCFLFFFILNCDLRVTTSAESCSPRTGTVVDSRTCRAKHNTCWPIWYIYIIYILYTVCTVIYLPPVCQNRYYIYMRCKIYLFLWCGFYVAHTSASFSFSLSSVFRSVACATSVFNMVLGLCSTWVLSASDASGRVSVITVSTCAWPAWQKYINIYIYIFI